MVFGRFVILIATTTVLTASSLAAAETVRRGLVACTSEELLDEAVTYATKHDNNGLMQLLTSGQCTILNVGAQVSVISPGFMTTTIRYRGLKLFTPSEAVR